MVDAGVCVCVWLPSLHLRLAAAQYSGQGNLGVYGLVLLCSHCDIAGALILGGPRSQSALTASTSSIGLRQDT